MLKDFLPYDVEMFQNGNINITGFQVINRESRQYALLHNHVEQAQFEDRSERRNLDLEVGLRPSRTKFQFQPRLAFVHDALLVLKSAFEATLKKNDSLFYKNFRHGELYNRGYPGIFCNPKTDRQNPGRGFVPFEHGRAIAKNIRGVRTFVC